MARARGLKFNWKDSGLLKGLRGWNRRWIRSERTLNIIGVYVSEIAKQSFDRQADPRGGAWEPLAPATQAYKATHGLTAQILVRTKQLKNSISYSIQPTGLAPSVVIGPTAHHGIHHQFGAPKAGIPARPFMGLGNQHESEIRRIVTKWINGTTR